MPASRPDQSLTSACTPWKPLIVCGDSALAASLGALWAKLCDTGAAAAAVDLSGYPSRPALLDAITRHAPNLCFLDVGSQPDNALRLLADLTHKRIPVVAFHTVSDADLIMNCLRRGAAEFLIPPFGREEVAAALQRISSRIVQRGPSGPVEGKVYCFMPGKGACGSTTVAAGLAFELHRRSQGKVLLADLDPLTGTVAFQLKLKSNYSFVHALSNSSRMDDDLWNGMVIPCRGIDVLLSPEHPVDLLNEAQDLPAIVDYWRETYESVILDTPGAYRQWGLSLAALCDELLLVTTNEVAAIRSTKHALDYLERNEVDLSKIKLIVNRYNIEAGLTQPDIEAALHMPVFHFLPSDYEGVQKALMGGKPAPSGTKVGKSIIGLAEALTGRIPPPKKQSLFGGVFSFLGAAG